MLLMSKSCSRYNLFISVCSLIINRVDDFEFEVFGIILVCHVAGDYALEEVFVDTTGREFDIISKKFFLMNCCPIFAQFIFYLYLCSTNMH